MWVRWCGKFPNPTPDPRVPLMCRDILWGDTPKLNGNDRHFHVPKEIVTTNIVSMSWCYAIRYQSYALNKLCTVLCKLPSFGSSTMLRPSNLARLCTGSSTITAVLRLTFDGTDLFDDERLCGKKDLNCLSCTCETGHLKPTTTSL